MGDMPAADWLLNYGIKRATKNQGMFYWNTGFHIFNTKRYTRTRFPTWRKSVKLGQRSRTPPIRDPRALLRPS